MAKPRVLGVIIARAGSKGLRGKHRRMLLNKPVVAYTIEAALAARSLDGLILTSDDPVVREVADSYGVWSVGRPEDLASDTATVPAAALYGQEQAREKYGFDADITVILYGAIPLRPAGLIDMAVEHLLTSGGDSVQSYSPVGKMHPDWMVKLEDGDRVVLNCPNHPYRRQDLRPMYMPNGAVLVTRSELLREQAHHPEDPYVFLGRDRRGVVHPQSHLIVDVDTPMDFYVAEAILKTLQEENDEAHEKQAVLV